MPLNPQAEAMLEAIARNGGNQIHRSEPQEAREVFNSLRQTDAPKEPVGGVSDHAILGELSTIPIRVYKPADTGQQQLPILVYYHGGGFVLGSLESHDSVCRSLTNNSRCIVVSVDYRLAPEHKFPAALDDAFAALQWVAEHAEDLGGAKDNIAVGGDSAGGNLAAGVSILAKERRTPTVVFQLLFYPSTGARATRSLEDNSEGFYLTKDLMKWFRSHYMNSPQDADNPRLSPFLYDDPKGLPPALVITAEYDPLRDDGRAYAEKLQAAGVAVEYVDYPGTIHGFVAMAEQLDAGQQALRHASAALRTAFHSPAESDG